MTLRPTKVRDLRIGGYDMRFPAIYLLDEHGEAYQALPFCSDGCRGRFAGGAREPLGESDRYSYGDNDGSDWLPGTVCTECAQRLDLNGDGEPDDEADWLFGRGGQGDSMKTLTREQLEQTLGRILDVFVDEDGFWIEDLSGGDVIQDVTTILQTSGVASHAKERPASAIPVTA